MVRGWTPEKQLTVADVLSLIWGRDVCGGEETRWMSLRFLFLAVRVPPIATVVMALLQFR